MGENVLNEPKRYSSYKLYRKPRGRGHFTLLIRGKRVIGCYRADYSGTGRIIRKTGFKSDDKCCHSEIKCLKANLHRKDMNKLKIVNIKVKYQDQRFIFTISKPCTDCKDTLRLYGLKGLYYFENENTIKYERFDDMQTIPSSWNL